MRLFSPTIGSYLVALVMLAVMPLMIIAGVLTWRPSELQRQLFDRSLVQTAQAAHSPLLDEGNFRRFTRCARA